VSTEQIGALGCLVGVFGCATQADWIGVAILGAAFAACTSLEYRRKATEPRKEE